MSYIGSTPTTQNFIAGTDQFTGNGSSTNFTLSRFVNSTNDIEVVIANVVQNPTSYLVNGNTLTISPAVGNGVAFYVRYLSTTLQSITIPPGSSVAGNFGLSGNLQFLGSAQRITGDFSNATDANRVMFQTSTANVATVVGVVPNGTSTFSYFQAYNTSNGANASTLQLGVNGSIDSTIRAGITGTGTYLPMTFYTGGSERMRIDTSGNVGIGTSSPAVKLQVEGDLRLGGGKAITSSTAGTFTGGTSGYMFSFGSDGNLYQDNYQGAFIWRGASYAERARIDSSGRLLIGNTSAGANDTKIYIYNSTTSGGANSIISDRSAAGTVGTNHILFNNANGTVGSITTSGSSTGYNTSSDYRLKHDIKPMAGALAKVAALKPVTYKWNADDSDGEGFIAHELAEVCPGAVHGEKDAVDSEGNPVYQGIDTSFLVATLTAAIQEQQAMIDELKAKVAALEAN